MRYLKFFLLFIFLLILFPLQSIAQEPLTKAEEMILKLSKAPSKYGSEYKKTDYLLAIYGLMTKYDKSFLNLTDDLGYNSMMYAVYLDNQVFIDIKFGINYRTEYLPCLLDRRASVPFFQKDISALDLAIFLNKKETVLDLIDGGAEINKPKLIGNTIFTSQSNQNAYTVSKELFDRARFCLSTTAKPSLQYAFYTSDYFTELYRHPLFIASCSNNVDALYSLVKKGSMVLPSSIADLLFFALLSIDETDVSYSRNRNKLLLFWEQQGFRISKETILESREKKVSPLFANQIEEYINKYERWKAFTPSVLQYSGDKDDIAISIIEVTDKHSETKENSGSSDLFTPNETFPAGIAIGKDMDSKVQEIKRKLRNYDEELGSLNKKEILKKLTLPAVVFLIMLFVYIRYGSLEWQVWQSILKNIWKKISPVLQIFIKKANANNHQTQQTTNNQTAQQQQNHIDTIVVEPIVPSIPKNKRELNQQRGWTKDNTLSIKVDLLTIEDRINHLPICNGHEKSIRRMMWYLRLLEEYPADKIKVTLGKDGLLPYLEKLWSFINIQFVRKVYMYSFFLLLEEYAKTDMRIGPFLRRAKEEVVLYRKSLKTEGVESTKPAQSKSKPNKPKKRV